jgi:endodeoxyribonuclease RusA
MRWTPTISERAIARNVGTLRGYQSGGAGIAADDPRKIGIAMSDASIVIVIGGMPTPKGRLRFTRKGFSYMPAATRKYEAHGRLAAQLAMDGRPPLAVPVKAEITVDLPVPQSWLGKRRDAALRGEISAASNHHHATRCARGRGERHDCAPPYRRGGKAMSGTVVINIPWVRVERARDCDGFYTIRGSHAWLHGSRSAAIEELQSLLRMERGQ